MPLVPHVLHQEPAGELSPGAGVLIAGGPQVESRCHADGVEVGGRTECHCCSESGFARSLPGASDIASLRLSSASL